MTNVDLRTSITHPLQIAELVAPGGGRIGVTFCPGKKQPYAATGAWDRDLQLDMRAIREWGAAVMISLVTAAEMKELSVEGMGDAAQGQGMTWLHLPITDVSVPDATWAKAWAKARESVHAELDGGGRALVHCKGGLGRAGTVASLILVERGVAAEQAISSVRRVRPGALETREQENFVRAHDAPWRGGDR